jgi:hypothetical protein
MEEEMEEIDFDSQVSLLYIIFFYVHIAVWLF